MTSGSSSERNPESGSARSGNDQRRAQAAISSASASVSQAPSPTSTKVGRLRSASSMTATCALESCPVDPSKGPSTGRPSASSASPLRRATGTERAPTAKQSRAPWNAAWMSALPKSGFKGASNGKFRCTGPAKCADAREATCTLAS